MLCRRINRINECFNYRLPLWGFSGVIKHINNFKWNITRLRIPTGRSCFFDNFTSVAEVLNLGLREQEVRIGLELRASGSQVRRCNRLATLSPWRYVFDRYRQRFRRDDNLSPILLKSNRNPLFIVISFH